MIANGFSVTDGKDEPTTGPLRFVLQTIKSPSLHTFITRPVSREGGGQATTLCTEEGGSAVINIETKARLAFESHAHRFPPAIWHCCQKACFAVLAISEEHVRTFGAIIQIHEKAQVLLRDIDGVTIYVPNRNAGICGSQLHFNAPR